MNTINNIRNILNNLGIFIVEAGWQNSAEGFYSVNLMIANTNLTTNGKGTTYEYALASGYGELMERLQNQSFFRLNADLKPEALKYKGFYYAPDEKYLSIKDIENSDEDWIKIQLSRIKQKSDVYELLKKWKLVSYEDISADFVALPYVNLNNDTKSYIPIKMISKMYMSNGMCAGNTMQEALVQGLSEVFERYVNKKILNDKITPPTIPRSYIEKYPRLDSMIKQIESSGNFQVIVKDCSLNEGYPVVGVVFINRDDQTYFNKFGSHPIFEIALERTLTELLQGQNVKNIIGVKEFSFKNHIDDASKNLIGILVNGSGFYPTEFFEQKFSYEFKEFKDVTNYDNKQMFVYLMDMLEKKEFNVFVRNVSYLGFPSYHIIVPGLSEIDEIDDIKSISDYIQYNKIKKHIRNIDNLSHNEIEDIISYFRNANYNNGASITKFLNLPVKNIFPWYYTNVDLFLCALHYKKHDFPKAYESFVRFLNNIQPNLYSNIMIVYYKCVRDYIGTRIDNWDQKYAVNFLSTFYPANIINDVVTDFGNAEQIFNSYGQIKCWNCEECKLRNSCLDDSTEKVYKTLKDRYDLIKK